MQNAAWLRDALDAVLDGRAPERAETRPVGFGEGAAGDYLRAVRAHFRPEMFNRIDHVLPFRALGKGDVVKIWIEKIGELITKIA